MKKTNIDKDFKNLVKFSNKLKKIKRDIEKDKKNINSYKKSINHQKTINPFFFQRKKLKEKKNILNTLEQQLSIEKTKLDDDYQIMIKIQKELDYFKELVGSKIILKVLNYEKKYFPREFKRYYKNKDDRFIKEHLYVFTHNPSALYLYVNDKMIELLNSENLEDSTIREILKESLDLEIEITEILRVLNVTITY